MLGTCSDDLGALAFCLHVSTLSGSCHTQRSGVCGSGSVGHMALLPPCTRVCTHRSCPCSCHLIHSNFNSLRAVHSLLAAPAAVSRS